MSDVWFTMAWLSVLFTLVSNLVNVRYGLIIIITTFIVLTLTGFYMEVYVLNVIMKMGMTTPCKELLKQLGTYLVIVAIIQNLIYYGGKKRA